MILSIIIPMFNSQSTIKRAIDSCLGSLTEIEIILIDDGSTDSTIKLVNKFYQELIDSKKIKIINSGHKGAGNARNIGLDQANGEWVTFLDSDDKFVDLTKVLLDIKKGNKRIDIIDYTENSLIQDNTKQSEITVNGKSLIKDNMGLSKSSRKYWDSAPWNKVYKTRFLRKNNIYFAANIKIGEDLVFNQHCLLLDPLVLIVHACVYERINNENSVTHTIVKQNILNDAVSLINAVLSFNISCTLKEEFIAKNFIAVFVRFLKSNNSANKVIYDLQQYKHKFTVQNGLRTFLKLHDSLNLIKVLVGWMIWKNPDALKVLYPLIKQVRY